MISLPPPLVLSAVADRYDVLLCDVWGVVHDGLRARVEACEALATFRRRGGTVVLISNSPRPAEAVEAQLDQVGVPRAAWDAFVTSGDLTASEIRRRGAQRIVHIGPPRDHALFAPLGVTLVDAAAAELVVVTGLDDDETETPDDYGDRLAALRARGLAMVCANPDRVVERGDKLIWCAGALAELYEGLGGTVVYAGKPYPAIYQAALALAAARRGAAPAQGRVLAIGDGIATDVAGAFAAGLPCLFVSGGIHGRELGDPPEPEAWARLFAGFPHPPLGWTHRLRWD
ncbi:MAG TPA: TIGR01459 family HAD-type hydrolase [Hyphomicrobiales bacterium]|nr:TIGR01459 family HAD-type hydrolase [Hyphomicrobiales bacterium]